MGRKGEQARKDPLEDIVQRADAGTLGLLIQQLAAARPDVRRECFEFLKANVPLPAEAAAEAEAEAIFALWGELEPDLAELDEYGGGDYDDQDHVESLLYDLCKKLEKSDVRRDDRRALLDEVMPYIRSGNAGMDDALYDVAYTACQDDADLRDFAERLESFGENWALDHARRIYRRIGDREKYLALRAHKMEYGADYHDLATFYWERGEKEQALATAREGMEKATGRMDELRSFLSDRSKESGDRQGFLDLQFAQATDRLTLASYKAFRRLCKAEEWSAYEPQMLAAVEDAWETERLKIHMTRKEYDRAVAMLSAMRYPDLTDSDILRVARQLEKKYPDKILAFYMSGLGNLDRSCQRKTYTRKAKVALKVRHIWLDVIKEPAKWESFARKVKAANLRRPAFQQEFARAIPDWQTL